MSADFAIDRLLRQLRAHDKVSEAEEAALRAAAGDERKYAADQLIVREGEELTASILLIEGLMCRYKDLSDGRRQISALHVPGDFVDLHGFTLKRLDHHVQSLTRCRVVLFPHDRLRGITEQHPHLTRLLWLLTSLDAAVHREWELSLGCRSATARIAHLLCELQARLEVVGLADERGFELDLTQGELAECLGLTNVHVNRVLRTLREDGLAVFKRGRVAILDRARLEQVADFNPGYLYLVREPH
jgi:CRP-like cAMP-binding protein